MGLDMYIDKKNDKKLYNKEGKVIGVLYNDKNDAEELCYWRKADQILAWFEREFNEMENCKQYPVSKDLLKRLYNDCKNVLDKRDDEYSKDNMPTQNGFFFGGTEYDKYYYMDLEETITMLKNLLENDDEYFEDVYFHAWW